MDLWNRIVAAHPAPPSWVVLSTAALALVVVAGHWSWRRSRHVVTIVHEAGHALVALLVGRRLTGIRLHSDTSGVTVSRGRPTGPGMVFTSLAGYVAPSSVGLGFALLIGSGRTTLLLWICIAVLLAMLVMVRNVFGVVLILFSGALLLSVSLWAAAEWQAGFAYLVAWFLLLGGVRPVGELQRKRWKGRAPDSDADQLARLTSVPAFVWVVFFAVVTVGSLVLGATWLLEDVTL